MPPLEKTALLSDRDLISEVKVITGLASATEMKSRVFDYVGGRLIKDSERLLHREKRWSESGGLTLHFELENVRVRNNAAVLLVWQLAGDDELEVRVWVTREERVIASELITTRLGSGGTYATNTNQRRLQMLSDQVVRKMVKRLWGLSR